MSLASSHVTLGEKLPILEILALGLVGQSDGESFFWNHYSAFVSPWNQDRHPQVSYFHMVHDPTAPEPYCCFQVHYSHFLYHGVLNYYYYFLLQGRGEHKRIIDFTLGIRLSGCKN